MALQTNGLIIPNGLVLPLQLFHINGGKLGRSETIVEHLKQHPVEFKKNKYYEGFSEVDSNGKMISVIYTIGQPIAVKRLKGDELSREVVYSQGRCEFIFHPKQKFVECRGPSWASKKGLGVLQNILNVEFETPNLNETAMVTLCKDATLVKSVQIADLDNPSLNKIQLSGEILDSAEWSIYRRQGTIRYFQGLLDLPSGNQLSTRISNKGTILIYKRGEGIPAQDVISTVKMIMKLANNK
jgi:hypothetical protein